MHGGSPALYGILLAPLAASLMVPDGAAQSLNVDQILADARGKVVHLRVQGTNAPGEQFIRPIHGTGVIIRTTSNNPNLKYRILTAGHVVMADRFWAPLGSRVNRDVYIIAEDNIGSQEYRPVTGVLVNELQDIATVFASPRTSYYAEIKQTTLAPGNEYVVVSWGLEQGTVAQWASPKRVKVIGPDPANPNLVQLEGALVATESGAPVFDSDGRVVALILMREVQGMSSNVALALPVEKVANWINGVREKPVIEPPPQPLAAVANVSGLCVFLGKASALGQLQKPKDAPFGMALLKAVSGNPQANFVVEQQPFVKITREAKRVDIASRCPEVRDGKTYYGSTAAFLDPIGTIKIDRVESLFVPGDISYAGTIAEIRPSQ